MGTNGFVEEFQKNGKSYTIVILNQAKVKLQRPTALRWGKTIITVTMNFTVELWLARNKREHDSNTDPVSQKNDIN
jgi:hypothetical protein